MLKTFDIEALIVELLRSNLYIKTMEQMQRTRLFTTGKDIKGTALKTFAARGSNVYADKTIEDKISKGQPTDRVTGLDTGKLYQSFTAIVTKLFVDFAADQSRFDDFADNIINNKDLILGLTEEDQKQLIAMLELDLGEKILENITEEHLVDTDNLKYV